jgi:hypothetical protein
MGAVAIARSSLIVMFAIAQGEIGGPENGTTSRSIENRNCPYRFHTRHRLIDRPDALIARLTYGTTA